MATEQTARTDTLFIMLDGNELKLSITTRAPKGGQENPPTPAQLARIRTGCIMRYTTSWRRAVSGDFGMDDFDKDLKSPIRVVSEDENETIQPSDYAPYVTIWQMGDWVKPQSPSLTIHDFDTGNEILQLNAICTESNSRIREIFTKGIKGMHLLHLSDFVQPTAQEDKTESPTSDNTNRIGRNAETLPDTNTVNMPNIESKGLRPAMLAPTGSQGDIMFASGKGDTAWKFALWATKKIDYQNKSAIQYADGEIRAYPVTGVEIKDVRGAIVASVKTQMGNIDIWKKKKDSDENTYDWQSFSEGMALIGILIPQLVAGFKKSFEAIALINISHSEDKTKEWKNFYGFRSMPQSGSTKPHEDLNTFFGAKEAATDDIPI